ncbi:MAG: universal stress protein [Burkholderiales bacterium]|nr:universal stress protein [Burkholderiales bacterium]MCJ7839212.1 universal stress protein [Burkholderiales bacterium]
MFKNILVPTDGSGFSNRAVATAAQLAQSLGAQLLLLHVRSPIESPHHVEGGAMRDLGGKLVMQEIEDEERKLLDAAQEIAATKGVKAETAFVAGYSTYEAIIRIASEQHCDLIVMASHGRRGISGFLMGSETQKVLTHTTIPVLIVR